MFGGRGVGGGERGLQQQVLAFPAWAVRASTWIIDPTQVYSGTMVNEGPGRVEGKRADHKNTPSLSVGPIKHSTTVLPVVQ